MKVDSAKFTGIVALGSDLAWSPLRGSASRTNAKPNVSHRTCQRIAWISRCPPVISDAAPREADSRMIAPAWKLNKVVAGVLATFVLLYSTVVTSVVRQMGAAVGIVR